MKRFSILFLALFFPVFALAAIENPYVVDEKIQVIFGDSVPVLTYFGLENYTQDYVDGYAHITFTYTHHACCFAGDPPRIYITNTDPRTTSTPAVRANEVLFSLLQFTHLTDWYLYDIQFDAEGYTISVKQSGETEIFNEHRIIPDLADSDWLALANLHPFVPPPDETKNAMAFTPVPVGDGTITEEINPVIIIPGIMGSAYKNGELVIDPILHTHDDLISTLVANGYIENENLFTFPYEWRDSNVFTANLLDDKIEDIKSICMCEKVDVVAHSMGGLVARAYIQSVDYDNDVDQLIFLGTPHRGSPKAYLQWEAGENDFRFFDRLASAFFLAESLRNGHLTIFSYIRNRPILSVQELLPIFDYIKDDDTELLRNYPVDYPRNFFLENLSDNISSLFSSGVRVVNIVGDSEEDETIERIRVVQTLLTPLWEHGEPEGFAQLIGDHGFERGEGDNTVTTGGSALDGVTNEEILASHNRIPTVAANRIVKIITGEDSVSNIDTGVNIDPKILLLQLLSPIDVLVTAPDGKKTGKNFLNNTEYDEIPLAFYSGYETDDEYITILNPLDGEYKIEVQGTDNGGEYWVLTSYVADDLSVTKETIGLTAPNQVTVINIQIDSSNTEGIETEKVVTLEVLLNDIKKSYELGWITDEKLKDKLVKKVEAIIRTEKRIERVTEKLPDGKKKERIIEKLERKIDKTAAKALLIELKGYRRDKINEEAYNIIKQDLEWLINN